MSAYHVVFEPYMMLLLWHTRGPSATLHWLDRAYWLLSDRVKLCWWFLSKLQLSCLFLGCIECVRSRLLKPMCATSQCLAGVASVRDTEPSVWLNSAARTVCAAHSPQPLPNHFGLLLSMAIRAVVSVMLLNKWNHTLLSAWLEVLTLTCTDGPPECIEVAATPRVTTVACNITVSATNIRKSLESLEVRPVVDPTTSRCLDGVANVRDTEPTG